MSNRRAARTRSTAETKVRVELDLDGSGQVEARTGVPFYDHLLAAFGRHSGLDLSVSCEGDLAVDDHHSVEDVAIVLGAEGM